MTLEQPAADQTKQSSDHIAVALDTSDWGTFKRWCELFGPRVGCLKVGLEAYVRWGPKAAETALAAGARVFLDLKLHDIPNTVAGAVGSVRSLGVHYVTVHAGGGQSQLEAAAEAAADDLGILAVTVLTSLDAAELDRLGMPGSASQRVLDWAKLAVGAGCAGIVGSALEAKSMRAALPAEAVLVTPGIRPRGAAKGDQKRVATPASAIADGADLLVIGRPLTQSPDPTKTLEAICREIETESKA